MALIAPEPKAPSLPPAELPGQYIVRFKHDAVMHLAANPVPKTASFAAVAAAMPDEIAGPLDVLRKDAGMQSVRPLFVPPIKTSPGLMALAAVHGAMAKSATDVPRLTLSGFQLVRTKQKKLSAAQLKRLRSSKAISLIEPVPNRWLANGADPLSNRQWGLRAIRWFDGTRPDATAVHVAVLDSGIDDGHEDLKDAIEEYRFDGNGKRDFLGHGTHVGGIVAAVVNNAVGIAGVANCRLHCWKIFNDPGAGSQQQEFNFEFYSAALASALDGPVKVINLSIGGTANSQTEQTVFGSLRDAGVVVVAAMGNEFLRGNPTEFPAGYQRVLAVGAIDEAERRAPFSCTGAHIGVTAPGVNILSTVPRQQASFVTTTDYDTLPGTSMATPHVAGAAALLYAARDKSKEAADSIVDRLQKTAKKVAGMRDKDFTNEYGSGVIDVAAALAVA